MTCPNCGQEAVSTLTSYGTRNACDNCQLWSWGNKPLVDAETMRSRTEAHNIFDQIWKKKFMSRSQAYEWLRKALGKAETPHMAVMSTEEAKQVITLAQEKLNQLNQHEHNRS